MMTAGKSRPAIFLDRDGVIIENRDRYVRSLDEVAFIDGALRSLAVATDSPYQFVIVTNQAGVGHGLIKLDDAHTINNFVRETVNQHGGRIDGAYICPHTPADGCPCRKPLPGMLLNATRDLNIDLSRSWMIGDALTDLQAGSAAGARSLLVLTGRGTEQRELANGYPVFDNLAAALAHIVAQPAEC